MESEEYHTVRTVPKIEQKNPRNRGKIDTPKTHTCPLTVLVCNKNEDIKFSAHDALLQ